MNIFDVDWNSDGNINFQDTVIDCMILDELEQDEKDINNIYFDEDDEDF